MPVKKRYFPVPTTNPSSRDPVRTPSTLVSFPNPLSSTYSSSQSIGLFAPAAGQYYRNQQRYRQSQFDRGTSMAICEPGGFVGEFGFEVSSSDGGFGGPRGGRGGWRGGRGGPRGGFRGGYGGGSSFENFNGSQASAPHCK